MTARGSAHSRVLCIPLRLNIDDRKMQSDISNCLHTTHALFTLLHYQNVTRGVETFFCLQRISITLERQPDVSLRPRGEFFTLWLETCEGYLRLPPIHVTNTNKTIVPWRRVRVSLRNVGNQLAEFNVLTAWINQNPYSFWKRKTQVGKPTNSEGRRKSPITCSC